MTAFRQRIWRPLVYGLGISAALLAVVQVIVGPVWPWALALALYAGWAALGAWLDLIRPIPWRDPPSWCPTRCC